MGNSGYCNTGGHLVRDSGCGHRVGVLLYQKEEETNVGTKRESQVNVSSSMYHMCIVPWEISPGLKLVMVIMHRVNF